MFKRIIVSFLIAFFISLSLSADEEVDDSDDDTSPSILCRSVSLSNSENSPAPLAYLEGEPSVLVHGCINVISGHFCDNQTDLVVHHGTDPLCVERSFSGELISEGTIGACWYRNHSSDIVIKKRSQNSERILQGILREDHGGSLSFQQKVEKRVKTGNLSLNKSCLSRSVTNTLHGCLSGQTSLKNQRIEVTDDNSCILHTGSHRHRKYIFLKQSKGDTYTLNRENKDSGNVFAYQYIYSAHENQLSRISITNNESKSAGFLSFPTIDKKKFKKELQYEIKTHDGRWVRYNFSKWICKSFILSSVERSDGPTVSYGYISHHTSKDRGICSLKTKRLPESRVLEAQYYGHDTKTIRGQQIKLIDRDPRLYRVSTLLAPAGTDAVRIPIYHFVYHLENNLNTLNGLQYDFKAGGCDVFDAMNFKTYYGFNADHRLTQINKFHGNGQLYTTEQLCWGSNDSADLTCLLARSHQEDGRGIFARSYIYDHSGNVLQDTLKGNLTGNNQISLQLHADGSPIDNGCESYIKHQIYSDDGFNLLLEESDGFQTTTYEYAPATSNMTAKFLGKDKEICRRWFYSYNENASLIKEIVDDGMTRDPLDLNGVTERHITYYTQSTKYPVGYPLEIEKKYLDLTTGEEVSIHKVTNVYTKQARISRQDHYDSNGMLCFTLTWKYDDMGNIIEETDAMGRLTTYRYDPNGNCIFEQGPRLDWHKEYVYDFMNRVIAEKEIHDDGINRVISHRYNTRGNRVATIDPYGNETNFDYDAFNRLIKTTSPTVKNEAKNTVRSSMHRTYNSLSHVTSEVNDLGVEKRMSYTIRGQLVETLYPDGTSERNTYHLNGSIKESKGKNGTLTRYTHDLLSRPIETEIFANGALSKTSIVYEGFRVTKEIDAMGIETLYSYYPDGKLKSKEKGSALSEYTYDSLERLKSTKDYCSDTDAIVKIFQYDNLNRIVEERVEDSEGNPISITGYTFDISGNVIEVKNYSTSSVNITTTSYDSRGNPVTITNGNGDKTVFTYRYDFRNDIEQYVPYQEVTDPLGNVAITIQDALGRTITTFKKNSFGKILQFQSYDYDIVGNLRVITDASITSGKNDQNIISLLDYDTSGRLVSCYEAVGTPEQKQTRLTYDNYGQKHLLIKNDGTSLAHSYDNLGRLISLKSSDGTVHYNYSYDLNGNPIQVDDLINAKVTTRIFDANNCLNRETLGNDLSIGLKNDYLGRTTEVTLPDGSGIAYSFHASQLKTVTRFDVNKSDVYTHCYDSYDLSGALSTAILARTSGKLQYTYDILGRINEIACPQWKEEISLYDAVGNILKSSITDSQGETPFSYHYDDLYQLTGEKGFFAHDYTYDSFYNRESKDGKIQQLNGLNQLLDDGTYQYVYDRNGNLIQKIGKDKTSTYTYDALDRLISFSSGSQKVDYLYDDSNRRLSKTFFLRNEDDDWQRNNVVCYLYQGLNEIGAVDEDGKISELRLLGIGKGAEIGAAIAMEFDGKMYVPIHDHIGNVSCLVDGTSGKVYESYRYSAFGETEEQETINPWRFSSKRHDDETGFIYFGRRYYDAETGRWVTPDPIGREGGPNLYAYVMNGPLTHIDLYGLYSVSTQSDNSFSRFFEGLSRLLTEIITIPGQIISLVGYHLVPIPYVKDVVEFGGWCLSGNNPAKYSTNRGEGHSKLMKHEGTGYLPQNHCHILYCGINTPETYMKGRLADYSQAHNGITVWGVYNSREGILTDIVEVFCQKLGIPTHTQALAEKATRTIVNLTGADKEDGRIIAEAHSQGSETVHNLSPFLKKIIDITAFGPARILHTENFRSANNYINRLDVVPFLDSFGLAKGLREGNVHYLPTTGCCIADHLYESNNFKKIRRHKASSYIEKFGVNR